MLECADQVGEKESGVRQVMSTMGLLTSPFWLTWALFEGQLSFPLYSLLFCMQSRGNILLVVGSPLHIREELFKKPSSTIVCSCLLLHCPCSNDMASFNF